jgi:hypothetical protein
VASSSAGKRLRRTGHRPEVDPLPLAGHFSIIRALPGGGLSERVESARRQLEESGATVNLLDDRGTPGWTFDPLPFVIAPDEWADLEAGLIQRATLLDGVLADLYGPQKLLAEKLVPPMLVHANRHFLRACRVTDGAAPTRHLAQYAVDLVRQGDGRWYVLADHTEVPAGIGYALEMRRVLARSLPEAFRSIPAPPPPSSTAGTIKLAPWRRPRRQPQYGAADAVGLSSTYFEHVISRARSACRCEGGDLARRRGLNQNLAGLRPACCCAGRRPSPTRSNCAPTGSGVTAVDDEAAKTLWPMGWAWPGGPGLYRSRLPGLLNQGRRSLADMGLANPRPMPPCQPRAMTVRPARPDREPIVVGMPSPPSAALESVAPARPVRRNSVVLAQPLGRGGGPAPRHVASCRRWPRLSRPAGRPAREPGRHRLACSAG